MAHARNIFINLPVDNLDRTKRFFSALGFHFDEQFTDENAACMVVAPERIYVMLLNKSFFAGFTPRMVAEAHQTTEVLLALDEPTRVAVDEMLARALAAGGSEVRPARDLGFMYQRSFSDPDGHIWEIFWMDPGGMAKQSDET